MNLSHLFDLSLKGRRDEVALEFAGEQLTFGEVAARAARMAHLLRARGLRRGDRLCVYLANCLEIVDLYLACVQLGVIYVPVNILYRGREISHILQDAEPAAVVSREALAPEVLHGVPLWTPEELVSEAGALPPEFSAEPLDGDAPAALVYTSGTTGVSKGAILTHNNLLANTINLLTCWQITDKDRLLMPLPLFHVHGLGNGLHCWLASGCRMRLLERFEQSQAVAQFLDFQPTLFFAVPTIYVRLLSASMEAARQIGARMRLFVSGSAPLAPQVLEEFRTLFGHTILERYGMTETLMNISNPYVGERRAGTVGIPMPGVSVRILDSSGNDAPDGVSGELHLRGPNVFWGYWRRDQATAAAFHEGWFRTGDMGVRSPDGYYTLEGRKSDLIISGGFNIYPREIEEFLEEQPGVAEAAVAGIPDPVKGEVPVAYVVPRGDVAIEELESQCRANLASFKVPRAFVKVEQLPRTALGKIQKHLLPKP
ncbi:MAG: AMP-binding protein [Bryobacterales bacterium]|nr:AMP-binding protein [Bryobacterales bacterium]